MFSTNVCFFEQDPYTNIAMSLYINYCVVKQENNKIKGPLGKDIEKALFEKDGDTFQNS